MSPDDIERLRPIGVPHTTSETCETCQACRIRRTVTTAETFSRAQVADLIARALEVGTVGGEQDGWDAAQATLSAAVVAAGPAYVFTERWHRMEGYRRRARREHDIAARWPWRTDHPGGPVPDWNFPRAGAR